jgi:hypothetical protein
MKTLFLNPPSFDGFDGAAGSRYQARREVRSFWYPTWLAQPAALVPGSRLIDAPARSLALADLLPLASDYELIVIYTSTPSFASDVKIAEAFRGANPTLRIGMVGAHVAVSPEASLLASEAIDFVGRNEFDYTIKEGAEGLPLEAIDGLSYRVNGRVVHNPERALIEDMDRLPFVVEVYRRDLVVEDYFIGYLLHPYLSLYTGRGCKSRCTFCLWPQTIGGAPLSHAKPGECRRGDRPRAPLFPTGEGVLFRRRHFHRRPAARRGDRAAAGPSGGYPGPAMPRPMSPTRRSRSCATMA